MQKIKNEDLNRKSVDDFKQSKKIPVCVVLDNVRSLNNVGSVFRTADAFLVEKIYLCGHTGTPPNKEIEKTALGATLSVDWGHYKSTLEAVKYLKENNYTVFSVEQVERSTLLHDISINKNNKVALVFGNEVYGVSQEVINESHGCIEIPQLGTKHSLNISVSAGIVIWEFAKVYF